MRETSGYQPSLSTHNTTELVSFPRTNPLGHDNIRISLLFLPAGLNVPVAVSPASPSRKLKPPAVWGRRPPPVRWRENVPFACRLPAAQTPPTYRCDATPTSSPPVSPGTAAVMPWSSLGVDRDAQLSSQSEAWRTHGLALPPSRSHHPAGAPFPPPPIQRKTQAPRPPLSPTQRGRLHCRSPLPPQVPLSMPSLTDPPLLRPPTWAFPLRKAHGRSPM